MQHLVWEIDVGLLLMSHLQCLPLFFQMKTFLYMCLGWSPDIACTTILRFLRNQDVGVENFFKVEVICFFSHTRCLGLFLLERETQNI